jgi:hypothetical protein
LAYVEDRHTHDRDEIVNIMRATKGNASEAARRLYSMDLPVENAATVIKRFQRLVASLGITPADYAD